MKPPLNQKKRRGGWRNGRGGETAVWMTVGDPRRRYPIRPSNDRLPCFCVSTAPAFPLARAGSTRGFSQLRFLAREYSRVLLPVSRARLSLPLAGCQQRRETRARARDKKSIDRDRFRVKRQTIRRIFEFYLAQNT